GLPSFYNYYKLDNIILYEADNDFNQCEELSTELKKYEGVVDLCRKLSYFLRNLDKILTINVFDNESCEYLNYWIYDRLFNKSINDIPDKNFYITSIPFIVRAKNYIDYGEICNFHIFKITKVDFAKMKKMFDLAVNYKSIITKFSTTDFKCSTYFDEYIKDSVKVYNDAKEECSTGSEKPYCSVYNVVDGLDSDRKLSKLQCPELKTSHSVITTSKQGMDGRVGIQGVVVSNDGRLENDFSAFSHSISTGEMLPISDTEAKTYIMAAIFPLIGIILLFFILYKFTPLGSRLHTVLSKKKLISYFEDEHEKQVLSENIYETEDVIINEIAHHIGYHSI
ncbi:PIR Superfamily Protein, partial [Plasmodium ovale curtisi]